MRFQFYINIANKGITEGKIITLHNVFLKKNLSKMEIDFATKYFEIENKIFGKLSKEKDVKIKKIVFNKYLKELFLQTNKYIMDKIQKSNLGSEYLEAMKKTQCKIWKEIYKNFNRNFKY